MNEAKIKQRIKHLRKKDTFEDYFPNMAFGPAEMPFPWWNIARAIAALALFVGSIRLQFSGDEPDAAGIRGIVLVVLGLLVLFASFVMKRSKSGQRGNLIQHGKLKKAVAVQVNTLWHQPGNSAFCAGNVLFFSEPATDEQYDELEDLGRWIHQRSYEGREDLSPEAARVIWTIYYDSPMGRAVPVPEEIRGDLPPCFMASAAFPPKPLETEPDRYWVVTTAGWRTPDWTLMLPENLWGDPPPEED